MSADIEVRTYRGVSYFPDYDAARIIAHNIPGARVVEYQRGWAVQYHPSGPYYPAPHDSCSFCPVQP